MTNTKGTEVTGEYSSYFIPDEWTFKRDDIAKAFDIHVREQLPWYDLATTMVAHFARHYLPDNGVMYDIGASTGNITKSISNVIESRNIEAHSIELSKEMCSVWDGVGTLHNCSCVGFEYKEFDFAVIFLVLMFIPEKLREDYLKNLITNLAPGGAILVFEKVGNCGGYLGNAMARLTLAGKVATGVPPEHIVAKELSLGGVQRPIKLNLFRYLVGVEATTVFQFGEFTGWVLESTH